jgi:hypothetical protein
MSITQQNKIDNLRAMFGRLYDIIQMNRGLSDRFADHPGFGLRPGARSGARSGAGDSPTVWEKIIAATERYEVDLPGYVYFAMRRIGDTRRNGRLFPEMLLDKFLLERYVHARENEHKSVRIRWDSQRVKFETELQSLNLIPGFDQSTEEQKNQFILLSRSPVFSNLFLFYKSILNHLPEVYERVREDALFQYSLFPAVYDDIIQSEYVIGRLLQKS